MKNANLQRDNFVYQEPKPFYKHLLRFLFGHVGLFFLVGALAAGGAWVYIQLEYPAEQRRHELKKIRARDIGDAYNYMSKLFWHYQDKNYTFQQWDRKVQDNLRTMEEFIINAVEQHGYDGCIDTWNYNWVFSKALLFTITIMTTIGYGHISPVTFGGQMFTIVYAMVATPMLLVFLANIGDSMATAFTYTYSRVCCRWCRSSRYKSEAGFGRRVKRLEDDLVGKEEYMPTDQIMVPITINLLVIVFYLMMGGVLFARWEGWDLASSCYFSFVTLSTIGFGDLVPGNSFLDYKDGASAAFKMLVTILYCIFGMALISMCIQMMQEQIVSKVRWFAVEVGIIESNEEANKPKIKYKRTRKGQVPETPLEADGNMRVSSAKRKRKKKKSALMSSQEDLEKADPRKDESEGFDNLGMDDGDVPSTDDVSRASDRLVADDMAAVE